MPQIRGGQALPVHPSSVQSIVAQCNGVGRMTETVEARRRRLIARIGAPVETRIPLPDKIFLPDQSQRRARQTDATATVKKKGRHFGGRRVDNPRSERLDFRVTREQRVALEAAAKAADMDLTTFVCWKSLGGVVPAMRRQPGPDIELARKILAQMGKCGANLNQIAHHLNACDFRDTGDELLAMQADHAAALEAHREICMAIMKALGV